MGAILVTVSLLLSVITLIGYYFYKKLNYWNERGVPHNKPSFPMGNFKGVGTTKTFFQNNREIYNKFKGTGPIAGFYFFHSPAAFILDLDLAKNILIKDFSNFADRGLYHNERDDPLSGHLFLLEGQRWRDLRHKLSTTFTSGKMKFMFQTVVDVSKHFTDVFTSTVKENPVVEIKDLLARYTTDVIGTCAFGVECNSLKDPNAEFRAMGKKIFTDHRHNRIIESFIMSFPKFARALNMRIISQNLHDFFLRVVRETVEYREKEKIVRNDFMNLLIELKNSKDGIALSIPEIAAQSFVFFAAGFETSSSTMGFCLYELASNQDVQDKLREDILEVLKRHNGNFTYECMQDMEYLEKVIKETLRKYSVVPHLARQAKEDYLIPNSNLVIEKGTQIIIPADCYMNDPNIYPDPEKFDPERFSPEEIRNRHACAWLPFGDGPRNCIGLRFGKMQAYIGLVALLSRYKFSICKETQVPLKFDVKSFLLCSEGGVFLKVESI